MEGSEIFYPHTGVIVSVSQGDVYKRQVLDIQFEDGQLPELLNAIEIDNHGEKLVVEVAQHLSLIHISMWHMSVT